MVGKIIRDHIEGGAKKLTVPGFGTFMRREGGEVIFVDLLRGDDHALSEIVEDLGGYSEVEAMAIIDRFIFEIKTAIERHGSAVIENFGVMTFDHKGVYQFRYNHRPHPGKETAIQERLFGPEFPHSPAQQAVEVSERQAAPVETGRSAVQPQRPQNLRQDRPPAGNSVSRQQSPPQDRVSRRTDTFLIIAIVAAVIALASLVFGMSSGNMPFLQPK